MTTSAAFSILLILISPAIGSFLGVLADRLPRGEDVVLKPSSCRTCKHRLATTHLMPVLSYILQRGRCAFCGTQIPPVTFYIELLAIGAAILAVLAGAAPAETAISAIWLWLLITLAVSDAVWLRLPDPLTLFLLSWAVLIALMPHGIGAAAAIAGAALGVGSFAALRWAYFKMRGRVGLGLGDVKLMAGLGAFSGPEDLPVLALIAALSTLGFAFLTRDGEQGMASTRPLPFGTALCFSGAVIWLLRSSA